jgi:tetratricopeptide (TPR) repeat protein
MTLDNTWDDSEWYNAFLSTSKLISDGKCEEALSSTNDLLARHDADTRTYANCAGFLIDIGMNLRDATLAARGVEITESLLGEKMRDSSKRTIQYNLANGYSTLGKIEILTSKEPENWDYHENKNYQKAKRMFGEQLEDAREDATPEVWVNYGNTLSHMGRKTEALHAYDSALALSPKHLMAMGNKGEALEHIAPLLGELRNGALVEAHQLLRHACNDPGLRLIGGAGPLRIWLPVMERIERRLGDKVPLFSGVRLHPPADLSDLPIRTRSFHSFCLTERLFLTYHIADEEASAALHDTITLSLPVSHGICRKPSSVQAIFDQIVEDFFSARYLAYLSETDEVIEVPYEWTSASHKPEVRLEFGTNLGLAKIAFSTAFNTLDKVAFFLNDYLNLGIKPDKVWFSSFWQHPIHFKEKIAKDERQINPAIRKLDDFSAVGLVDIARDMGGPVFKRTLRMRRAQTHRCLVVQKETGKSFSEKGIESIDLESLRWETLRLLRVVKSSIFSLAALVSHVEYARKTEGC